MTDESYEYFNPKIIIQKMANILKYFFGEN